MSVRRLRNHYVERFATLEGVHSCVLHDELFDLDELSRKGAAGTPLVYVIVMEGLDDADDLDCDGVSVKDFDFVAVVLAKSHEIEELTAGDVAMTIAGRIVNALRRDPLSEHAMGERPAAKMGNATTSKTSRQGQAIWIVGWSQLAAVTDLVEIATVDLETIHTDYRFNPEESPEQTAATTVTGLTEAP